MSAPKLAYDIPAAADAATCSPDIIRGAISTGQLQARKPGKAYLILDEDLQEWLRSLPVVNS